MQLAAPWLLLLWVPLALCVGWLERRVPGSRARRLARIGVRLLLLAIGIVALAGPTRVGTEPLARRLVIAVDRSDDMQPQAYSDAHEIARAAAQAAGRAGVDVTLIGFTTRTTNPVIVRPAASDRAGRQDDWPRGAAAGTEWPHCAPGDCGRFRRIPAAADARWAVGLHGARAAFGAHESGAVLLLTTGRGDGTGANAARRSLSDRGLLMAAIAVPTHDTPQAVAPQVVACAVPETTRGPFVVRAAIEHADATTRVALRVDGMEGDAAAVPVPTSGEIEIEVGELAPGVHEVAVLVMSADDEATIIDFERRLVRVGAPPRIYAMVSDPETSPLFAALAAQGMQLVPVPPENALEALSATPLVADLVVGDAAALAALPPDAQEALLLRVREGLGLMLEAGGADAAWNALAMAPISEALPIMPLEIEKPPPPIEAPPPPPEQLPPPLDPPEDADGPGIQAERRPEKALPITLLLVIDRSASMYGAKMMLAIEGARRAATALSPWDRIGVITFADSPSLDLAPRSARDAHELPLWLSSVRAAGSTDIFSALRLAQKVLQNETSPIQHVILLSDGKTAKSRLWHHAVGPLGKKGVTLTAVGIGPQHDRRQLRRIVQFAATGSSVVSVYEIQQLPTIMTRDTRELAERRQEEAEALDRLNNPNADREQPEEPAGEDPLPPPPPLEPDPPTEDPESPPEDETRRAPLVRARPHEATIGFADDGLPKVGPPRPNVPRPDAAVLLVRKGEGEPGVVLAARRFGLGRVVAWTLPDDDAGIAAWPLVGQLFAQSARSAMAPEGVFRFVPRLAVHHEPDGDLLTVDWPRGEAAAGALEVTWRDASGREVELGRFTPEDGDPRRELPRAAAGSLVELTPKLEDGRPMAPLTYLAPEPQGPDLSAGDQTRLTATFGPPPVDATAFARAVPGGRRERRLPIGDLFLWILVALLPLDVWLHRRGGVA